MKNKSITLIIIFIILIGLAIWHFVGASQVVLYDAKQYEHGIVGLADDFSRKGWMIGGGVLMLFIPFIYFIVKLELSE